jgi:hypothetical protein
MIFMRKVENLWRIQSNGDGEHIMKGLIIKSSHH